MGKFDFQLDFRSGNPIYVQIMNQIQHKIAAGEVAPDDQLPTVRQLAADLRVNFNTIARAYRMLDEAGVISTQHGRGTFILAPPSEEAADKRRREDLARLTEQYITDIIELGFPAEKIRETFEIQLKRLSGDGENPSEQRSRQ